MARIRTIKPEFWTDEKLSLLDPLTRLVFLGLVSLADDYGRLIDNVKSLDGALFPHTDDSIAEPLDILASLSRVLRYTSASGQNLLQIVGWKAHQKVDHPGKEILPAPTKEDWAQPVTGQRPIQPPRKPARKPREALATDSRSDLGPRTSTNEHQPERYAFMGIIKPIWKERYGGDMPKGAARDLAPVNEEIGTEALARRLTNYVAATEAQYVSIPRFKQTHGAWDAAKGVLPLDKAARDAAHYKKMGYVV